MSYIGSSATPLPVAFSGVRTQSFSGTGSQPAFTLSRAVSAVTDIEVVVNNVQQSPFDSSYNISGATLTFSEAPSSGTNNIYVIFRDQPVGSLTDPTSVKTAGDTMTGPLVIKQSQGAAYGGWVTAVNLNGYYPGYDENAVRATIDSGIPTLGTQNTTFGQIGLATRGSDGLNRRLVVGAYGAVMMPYQPAFSAYGGTWTVGSTIVFGSTATNIGNNFNTSTGRFTAPVAGSYLITAQMFVGTTGTTQANIEVNAASTIFELKCNTGEGAYQAVASSKVVYLNVGDYVNMKATNGSSLMGQAFTFLSGYLIG
jgi:hypothetical protein